MRENSIERHDLIMLIRLQNHKTLLCYTSFYIPALNSIGTFGLGPSGSLAVEEYTDGQPYGLSATLAKGCVPVVINLMEKDSSSEFLYLSFNT